MEVLLATVSFAAAAAYTKSIGHAAQTPIMMVAAQITFEARKDSLPLFWTALAAAPMQSPLDPTSIMLTHCLMVSACVPIPA
jgi:hypothetical protein